MPFFSSLLGQMCWREGPWTTAWYVLLLQNLFRMQFSTHLLRFGSSWQNKASAPKRIEKTRQWKSEKSGNLGHLSLSLQSPGPRGSGEVCYTCMADPPQPGSRFLKVSFQLAFLWSKEGKGGFVSYQPHSSLNQREKETQDRPFIAGGISGGKEISMGQYWVISFTCSLNSFHLFGTNPSPSQM